MTKHQHEVYKIAKLITDMVFGDASKDELERAIKHSAVVIDSKSDGTECFQSEIDNDIESLRVKYQGKEQK